MPYADTAAEGVTLSGIAKSFGRTRVLETLDLAIEPGEFLTLVGPSGCGKSTLLRIIAGLETADRGSVGFGLDFFDQDTKSYSYVVADERAGVCAVIDSVLDFDIKSGRTSTQSADALIAAVKERGWRTEWVLETHAHADHLTAAPYVKTQLGGKLGIGANIRI